MVEGMMEDSSHPPQYLIEPVDHVDANRGVAECARTATRRRTSIYLPLEVCNLLNDAAFVGVCGRRAETVLILPV